VKSEKFAMRGGMGSRQKVYGAGYKEESEK
jgi:hypothetical protein